MRTLLLALLLLITLCLSACCFVPVPIVHDGHDGHDGHGSSGHPGGGKPRKGQ